MRTVIEFFGGIALLVGGWLAHGLWIKPLAEPLRLCQYTALDPGYVVLWNNFIDICAQVYDRLQVVGVVMAVVALLALAVLIAGVVGIFKLAKVLEA